MLLEHFLSDNNECIYFSETRFINKLYKENNKIADAIIQTVQQLKKQHHE